MTTMVIIPFYSFQLLYCSKSAPPTSAQQPRPLVQSIVRMSSELDYGLDFADANQQDHQQP